MAFFFFSSRRRHTRSLRDWSSDVCSSDLPDRAILPAAIVATLLVPRVVHAISETLAIGGDLPLVRAWHRHRLLDATCRRNREESRHGLGRVTAACGRKEDVGAVGRPPLNFVCRWMPR